MNRISSELTKWALGLPGTGEGAGAKDRAADPKPQMSVGVACAGTAAERATVRANGKAFLFVGAKDAMMKLTTSLGEAKALEAKAPDRYKVGANGWVKVFFDDSHAPDLDTLHRWIEESLGAVTGGSAGAPAAKKPKKPAETPARPPSKRTKGGTALAATAARRKQR